MMLETAQGHELTAIAWNLFRVPRYFKTDEELRAECIEKLTALEVNSKVYHGQCPCGLSKCDYHEVC